MLLTDGDPNFGYIRDLVRQRCAVVLRAEQAYLAESRLMPLAEEYGFQSVTDLVTRLRAEPFGQMHRRVVEAMTTNETCFFRDAACFDALRDEVLPALHEARGPERQLRIWSAACATGQEPYSIAMLLRETFADLGRWQVELLASDLAADVLRRAEAGVYSQLEVSRGLPASMLLRHFRKEGIEWQLADDIRRMVQFQQLNLIEPWPASVQGMDVILLRNVLIYFDVETKRSLLANVRRALRPDGYLFLGAAETTFMLDEGFERNGRSGAGGYRLRPGAGA